MDQLGEVVRTDTYAGQLPHPSPYALIIKSSPACKGREGREPGRYSQEVRTSPTSSYSPGPAAQSQLHPACSTEQARQRKSPVPGWTRNRSSSFPPLKKSQDQQSLGQVNDLWILINSGFSSGVLRGSPAACFKHLKGTYCRLD